MRTNKRKRELIEKPTFDRNVKTKLTSDIPKPSAMRYTYSKVFNVTDNQPIVFKKMMPQIFKPFSTAEASFSSNNKLLDKLLIFEKKNEKGKNKIWYIESDHFSHRSGKTTECK